MLNSDSACLTPNIDKLSKRGVRFQRAYTPNAVCSPARACLMTGLLPHNHGVLHVTHTVDDDQSCLRSNLTHWAQILQESGYRTGYFGKWHVERSNDLKSFGWERNGSIGSELYLRQSSLLSDGMVDELVSEKFCHDPEGYRPVLMYGVTKRRPEQRGMGIVTSLADNFLEEVLSTEQPWCCFVSLSEPHDPFVCGEDARALYNAAELRLPPNVHDSLEKRPGLYRKASRTWRDFTDDERREAMACYYGSISEIDSLFGKLIDKIDSYGVAENTIVVLTADHGELLGAHGMYTKNVSASEEIYNIPLIIAGPSVPQDVLTTARVGLHDVGPTLLDIAKCKYKKMPDSCSFVDLLSDPKQDTHFQTGFAEYHGGRTLLTQRVVWNGDWKYVFNGFDEDELYNLKADPYELLNLIDESECDKTLRCMCSLMWAKVESTGDHSLLNSYYPSLRLASYGPQV